MKFKYILTGLLFWTSMMASAQVMLPAYQGVFSKKISAASNGLDFDGVDDYVTVPSGVYFNGDLTIEAWVYPKSYSSWGRIIDFGNGPANNTVFLAFSTGTTGYPNFRVENSQFQSTAQLPLNTWSHVAATLSGTSAIIYVNGVNAGSATLVVPSNVVRTNNLIGFSNWTVDDKSNVILDDVRIWTVARTQSQIQSNMNTELIGTEAGLKAYYPFNQGIAAGNNSVITTVTDKTANAINGTLTNFSKTGATSNFVVGKVIPLYDGLSATNASTSAYKIKQDFPSSTDGFYWIKNVNINGGAAFQIYADMTTDGGGWTLILCNASNNGWNYTNAIALNTTTPSINSNYSIIGLADYIKKSASGFQYMIDAYARRSYGGIWTANGNYSFTNGDNSQINVTINTKFGLNGNVGTWTYADSGIEKIMPWYSDKDCSGYITTSYLCGGTAWWGTLVSEAGWGPAPWIADGCGAEGCMQNPGIIWYWVR